MSAKIALRTFRPISNLHSLRPRARRSFITLPGTEPQSLAATRVLPYEHSSLYDIIADVDKYSTFLPYCVESKVTKWSKPDKNGKRWPSEADLKVGWGGFEETFASRLFCVPGAVVEALGGEAVTTLSKSDISHHSNTIDVPASANHVFQNIITRWTVRPLPYKPPAGQLQTDKAVKAPGEHTEVQLTLDFQFSNPMYAALSKAVAPKVAGIMIEAFETRARECLDCSGAESREKIL